MTMEGKNTMHLSCMTCKNRKDSLFNYLDSEHVSQLDSIKRCSLYRKGETIFLEGSRPSGVFCIHDGKVKVSKLGIDGKEQIIHIFKDSDLLGYRMMLADEPYPVTAETLEDCNICFIPKSQFLDLLKENPLFNERIIKELGRELGATVDSITNLAQKTIRERLALTLLALKDTYYLDGYDDGPVAINLSRQDLANIVGTATENLIRILQEFKENKLVKIKGRKITVSDAAGLAEIAHIQ